MIELWRRLSLLTCLFGAVLLAFAASLSPVVIVEHFDFARNQEREGSYMGLRIPSEEAVRLRRLPSDAYIAAKTKGKLITVDGPHWAELFGAATDVAKGKAVAERWAQRLPSDQYPAKVIFFRSDEPPVAEISKQFLKNHDTVFLARAEGQLTQYLRAEYRFYHDEDFHLGSGFASRPTPPTRQIRSMGLETMRG